MEVGFPLTSKLPLSGQSLPPPVAINPHINTLYSVDQPTSIPFGRKSETGTRKSCRCRKSQDATRESKRAKRNLVHARAILIKLSASARTAAARTTSGSATARSATRIAGRSAGSGGRPGVIVRSGGRFGIIVGSRRSGVIVRCRRAIIGRSRLGSIVGRRSSRGSAVRRRSVVMIRGGRLVRDAVGVAALPIDTKKIRRFV